MEVVTGAADVDVGAVVDVELTLVEDDVGAADLRIANSEMETRQQ